jgi:hypothetical protein
MDMMKDNEYCKIKLTAIDWFIDVALSHSALPYIS